MSTFNYARTAATADRLIKKFGQAAVLRLSTPSDGGSSGKPWDPSSDTSQPVVAETKCTVVVIDYTTFERQNSDVQVGDRKALVSPKGLTGDPTLATKLVIGGDEYSIIPPVSVLSPAGKPVLYTLQVRR